MAKLLFGILMSIVWWMLHALQLDEEAAMGTLNNVKQATNSAAHAAAQQLDRNKLELGVLAIDDERAEETAAEYLMDNLLLDSSLQPKPNSFLDDQVEVRVFEVLGDEVEYPYTYRNAQYDYEVTFERPGVVLIVHVKYPMLFGVLAPIEWDVRSTAELVY